MALGFQDCCNSSNYFYLTGIPGNVSENEVYFIETLQGETFCATYVNVPTLNYQAPTYNLISMTQQGPDEDNGLSACQNCITTNPCPSVETIFLSQFGPGSIATGTDCYIKTIFPLVATCQSTPPTYNTDDNGVFAVYVVGGTPPYVFYSAGTNSVFSPQVNNNVYTIFDGTVDGGVPENIYSVDITDSNADFFVRLDCFLDAPPPPLAAVCNTVETEVFLGPGGQILQPEITGGSPPYTFYFNGTQVLSFPITDLFAGSYNITVYDSGSDTAQTGPYSLTFTCTVPDGPAPDWPDVFCLGFVLSDPCANTFLLTFERRNTGNNSNDYYNYRPIYDLTTPQYVGVTSMTIFWEESDSYTGWISDIVAPDQTIDTLNPCNLGPSPFSFEKETPDSELPTGNWYGTGMFSTIQMVASDGFCPIIINAIVTKNPCKSAGINIGELQVEAYGGNGGPYDLSYVVNNLTNVEGSQTGVYIESFTINGNANGTNNNTTTITATDSDGNTASINITVTFDVPSTLNYQATNYPNGLINGFATTWAENYVEYGGNWNEAQTLDNATNNPRTVTLYSTVYMDLSDDTLPLPTPIELNAVYATAIKPVYKIKLQPGRDDYERVQDLFEYYTVFSEAKFYWPGGGSVPADWYDYSFNRDDVYQPFPSWGNDQSLNNSGRLFEGQWTLNVPPTPKEVEIIVRKSDNTIFNANVSQLTSLINKGGLESFNEKLFPGFISGAQGGDTYDDPLFTISEIITQQEQGTFSTSDLYKQISTYGFTYGTNPDYNGGILTFGGNPTNSIFQNYPASFVPTTGYYENGYPKASVGFMRLVGWYDAIVGCNENQFRVLAPNGFGIQSANAQLVLNGVASFIPGEKRGLTWINSFVSVGELLPLKQGVKFAFRHKTFLKSKDIAYQPDMLLDTQQDGYLDNTCILDNNIQTGVGNFPINSPNVNSKTVGGRVRIEINYGLFGAGSPLVGVNRVPYPITNSSLTTPANNISTAVTPNLNPNNIDEITTACVSTSTTGTINFVLGTSTGPSNSINDYYSDGEANYPTSSVMFEIDVNKVYDDQLTNGPVAGVMNSNTTSNWTDLSPIINAPRPQLTDYQDILGITQAPDTTWTTTIPWVHSGWPS